MLAIAAFLILTIHFVLVAMLCVFGAHRLLLTWLALRQRWSHGRHPDALRMPADWPSVTVQLPVYNEKFVIERLIDAVAALDYPWSRLQIQVLDDSSDETGALAEARIQHYRALGLNIERCRRGDRSGYKAGALAAAFAQAEGDLIAIFDADFVPNPDFLKATLPSFADPAIGMVQARWAHLNQPYSTLTEVQAILLDAHFAIDQSARAATGRYFNFNGTAGVWRRQAIVDAGGWQTDTITEDLDLSYRAQLAGWRFAYIDSHGCPSELPVEMNAFKSQQHRWAKGAIQVMRKLLPSIWRAPISLRNRIEATLHLSGNLAYLLMLVDSAVFLVPSILVRRELGWLPTPMLDLSLFVLATLSHLLFFMAGQWLLHGWRGARLLPLPALLAAAIGLGLNNGQAVIEGLRSRRAGDFVRTPKLGHHAIVRSAQPQYLARYRARGNSPAQLELLLAGLYAAYAVWAASQQLWLLAPFLILFAAGFLFIGGLSLREVQRAASGLTDTRLA
ncbi:glycosyltransferase [Nevskia sp.]|uniref:glycosyltransferase n=1 Tax=Nevskia sp. TaxID=1929292 RepID=UPI0025DE794C|nr:glycosyltransferase [Nevskia sp.]